MEVVRGKLESEGKWGLDDLAMKYGIKGKTTVVCAKSVSMERPREER